MWSLQMDGWRDNGRSVMAKAHKSLWVERPENRSASIKHQYLPLYDKRVLIVFFYKSTIETRIIIKHQSLAKYIYFIHLCIKSFINVIGNIKWICRHSNTIPPLLEHMVAYIYIYIHFFNNKFIYSCHGNNSQIREWHGTSHVFCRDKLVPCLGLKQLVGVNNEQFHKCYKKFYKVVC